MENEVYIEIKPVESYFHLNFQEMWQFRELFYVFSWRDIKVRYKQAVLGMAWAVMQPLLVMVVFSVFFGNLMQVPSDGVPYPIFVYCGLLFWNYFSSALTNASNSLVNNSGLIQKVYFPKMILPISSSITSIIDYFLSFIVFIGLLLYFKFFPTLLGLVLIPLLLFISFLCSTGIGLFLAALNVKYRDVRFILPFFIQLMLYVTPVIYPATIIPHHLRWMIYLNPMSAVISSARCSFLGTNQVDWLALLASLGTSMMLLLLGVYYFNRTEKFFADEI